LQPSRIELPNKGMDEKTLQYMNGHSEYYYEELHSAASLTGNREGMSCLRLAGAGN
jgi:hypothetical protein